MIYVVTHANSGSVIDGRTNTVTATLPADRGPWQLRAIRWPITIDVANRLSDRATVIDRRTTRRHR
jgi:YVTN family beta-propeller protein